LFFPFQLTTGQNESENEWIRLEKQLPFLSGEEKLDTLRHLVNLTFFKEKGRYFLNEYEKEAIKQKHVRAQAYAKAKMVELYFYQFDTDSIFIAAPIAEEYARTNKIYSSLFGVQQVVIQRYAHQGEYAKAAQKAKNLYNEAKELDDYYGMASASAAIGNIYSTLGIADEALRYFKESVNILHNKGTGDEILYIDLYRMIIHNYRVNRDYENVLSYTDSLEIKANKFEDAKVLQDFTDARFYIEARRASVYLEKGNFPKAWSHIMKADSIFNLKSIPVRVYTLNALKGNYFHEIKEYDKALVYSQKAVDYCKEKGLENMETVRHYTGHAYNLLKLGHYKDGAILYEEASELANKISEKELHTQINQLRVLYDLDKLELQAENDKLQIKATHNRFLTITIVSVFLIIIIVIVVLNMRRIQKKNIRLVQRIHEQDIMKEEIERQQEELEKLRLLQSSQNIESFVDDFQEDNIIISKLKTLLKENPVYTNPTINRKMLAEMIGTNENYLRKAIKDKLGYTFNEYMNELRLNHAKKLLALPSDNYTIEAIAFESGFGTRSTLYRQFRTKYELSPDEYRKVIRGMK